MDEKTLIEHLKAEDSEARKIFWNRYRDRIFRFLVPVARCRGFRNAQDGSWTNDYSDAEDILMQTFIKAGRDLYQYRGDRPIEHWLIVIAARTAASFYREEKRHHPRRPELIAAEVPRSYSAEESAGSNGFEADQPITYGNESGFDAEDDLQIRTENNPRDQHQMRVAELSAYAFESASNWGRDGNVDNERFQIMTQLVQQLPTDHRLVIVLRVYERKTSKETAEIMGISEEAVRALKYRATSRLVDMWKKTHSNGKGGRFNG